MKVKVHKKIPHFFDPQECYFTRVPVLTDKFIVVEICDREVSSATECESIRDAIHTANVLLLDHIRTIDAEVSLEEPEDFSFANAANMNAWCSLSDLDWDAHIIKC